jgi:hypothetical protein
LKKAKDGFAFAEGLDQNSTWFLKQMIYWRFSNNELPKIRSTPQAEWAVFIRCRPIPTSVWLIIATDVRVLTRFLLIPQKDLILKLRRVPKTLDDGSSMKMAFSMTHSRVSLLKEATLCRQLVEAGSFDGQIMTMGDPTTLAAAQADPLGSCRI